VSSGLSERLRCGRATHRAVFFTGSERAAAADAIHMLNAMLVLFSLVFVEALVTG
jgi:hypothetical protein